MAVNILVIILSYLIGAIPLGLVLVRVIRRVDIRDYGSGKIGATNVLRMLGIPAAVGVFAFDAGKGVFAVLLARALGDLVWVEAVAAFAAVLGHNWSVFFRFSGGRGVSSALGSLLVLTPIWGLVALCFGFLIVWASRYVSLGSLLGGAAAVILLFVAAMRGHEPWEYFSYAAIAVALIWVQHHDNIGRLMHGKERRLGEPPERRVTGGRGA